MLALQHSTERANPGWFKLTSIIWFYIPQNKSQNIFACQLLGRGLSILCSPSPPGPYRPLKIKYKYLWCLSSWQDWGSVIDSKNIQYHLFSKKLSNIFFTKTRRKNTSVDWEVHELIFSCHCICMEQIVWNIRCGSTIYISIPKRC